MFIQTETTPNPATLKFLPGRPVMESGTAYFAQAEDGARSPIARRLFAVAGVSGVFLGSDFITVTKAQDADWATLKPRLLASIMDHFVAGEAMLDAAPDGEDEQASDAATDDPLSARIRELIDTRVRPSVAQDGGDIVFRKFEGGIVYLKMQGACAGCPSSTATLRYGIENMLRYYVPEVESVQPVD
jgi:Fe-S cluster biogenesis protein NfuA